MMAAEPSECTLEAFRAIGKEAVLLLHHVSCLRRFQPAGLF